MVRAEFESWPKLAASHDHTPLGQAVAEAKPAINAYGTDCNKFVETKAEPKLIQREILRGCMLHEQDLES